MSDLVESYFDDPDHFDALVIELKSWQGTPFVECKAVKGGGADCIQFIERSLFAVGAIGPVTFPKYVTRGGGAEMLRVLIERMSAVPRLQCVWSRPHGLPKPEIKRGDVLIISTGTALHHAVIVAEPPVIWHNLTGVAEGNLFDPIVQKHTFAIYRARP